MPDLRRERVDYQSQHLDEDQVPGDPLELFDRWLNDALAAKGKMMPEPTAMTLSTVRSTPAGPQPTARVVLLKEFDERGFCFYTNYDSAKGKELAVNDRACGLFYWMPLFRQVRVEGQVVKVSAAESDDYFEIRPRGAQIGAWASRQSAAVKSYTELQTAYMEADLRFPDDSVPRPLHWGGYRLVPDTFEFWVGRPSRMHDRLIYRRTESGWTLGRLAP